MSKSLTTKALQDAAKELGVELAAVRAVDEIESRGAGFDADGRVKILFERHKFHGYTHGNYDESHPNISNKTAGGYGSSKSQYGRFSQAFELAPEAAMKSASWGRYQIMGFNHKAAGFSSVGEFVDAMKVSEDEHLKAFVKIIKAWGLAPELRAHDWAAFASQYNGAAYKKNKYDTKLAAAYAKFSKQAFQPDVGDVSVTPSEDKPAEVKPEEDKKPVVETTSTRPPVVEVAPSKASITTKIGATLAPIGTFFTAVGLKIGGIQVTNGVIITFLVVFAVSLVVAAWIYNEGQKRAQERLRLSMNNMADPERRNVVAGSS